MKPNNRGRGRGEDKPVMTDEQAAEFRRRLIAAGVVKEKKSSETGNSTDFMTPEEAEKYRQNLIDQGVLKPGSGFYRSSRPRMPRPNGSGNA